MEFNPSEFPNYGWQSIISFCPDVQTLSSFRLVCKLFEGIVNEFIDRDNPAIVRSIIQREIYPLIDKGQRCGYQEHGDKEDKIFATVLKLPRRMVLAPYESEHTQAIRKMYSYFLSSFICTHSGGGDDCVKYAFFREVLIEFIEGEKHPLAKGITEQFLRNIPAVALPENSFGIFEASRRFDLGTLDLDREGYEQWNNAILHKQLVFKRQIFPQLIENSSPEFFAAYLECLEYSRHSVSLSIEDLSRVFFEMHQNKGAEKGFMHKLHIFGAFYKKHMDKYPILQEDQRGSGREAAQAFLRICEIGATYHDKFAPRWDLSPNDLVSPFFRWSHVKMWIPERYATWDGLLQFLDREEITEHQRYSTLESLENTRLILGRRPSEHEFKKNDIAVELFHVTGDYTT